jgi:RNA polymerase sigma-70 factor (ECF subfamily)
VLVSETDEAPRHRRVAELVRANARSLESYALALCGNPPDAQDLVQQTFERVLTLPRERLPRHNGRAWLCTVLRHLFLDAQRRETSGPRRVDIDLGGLPDVTPDEPPAPRWQELTAREVRAALERLDEPIAATFCLHALEGRSYADISRALGVPVNTVGTRLLRARRQLRVVLSERLP